MFVDLPDLPHGPGGRPARQRFDPGRLLSTPGAEAALYEAKQDFLPLLSRHLAGDWGDLCDEDRAANDRALEHGGRLFSSYELLGGTKLWCITEADRSATTFLLPSEY